MQAKQRTNVQGRALARPLRACVYGSRAASDVRVLETPAHALCRARHNRFGQRPRKCTPSRRGDAFAVCLRKTQQGNVGVLVRILFFASDPENISVGIPAKMTRYVKTTSSDETN